MLIVHEMFESGQGNCFCETRRNDLLIFRENKRALRYFLIKAELFTQKFAFSLQDSAVLQFWTLTLRNLELKGQKRVDVIFEQIKDPKQISSDEVF